jgi:gamma-glutamyltranspeptidase
MQGNGPSPAALTLDKVRDVLGTVPKVELPPLHALTVPVPGAVALWGDALMDWGKLDLAQVRSHAENRTAYP